MRLRGEVNGKSPPQSTLHYQTNDTDKQANTGDKGRGLGRLGAREVQGNYIPLVNTCQSWKAQRGRGKPPSS